VGTVSAISPAATVGHQANGALELIHMQKVNLSASRKQLVRSSAFRQLPMLAQLIAKRGTGLGQGLRGKTGDLRGATPCHP
jgi:hypothetical protein